MNEFEDLLNSVSQVEPGDVVSAEVLTVDANQANVAISGTGVEGVLTPVSYTHLDVYKRQRLECLTRRFDLYL